LLPILAACALLGADPAAERMQAKLDRLDQHGYHPGDTVIFTSQEINSWARVEVPKAVPEGVRDERVELGAGTATAYALVDFLKMRQSKGKSTNFLIAKFIEGERPLKVSVRFASGGGLCTVYLTRVEIGGVSAEGSVLDFLVKNFFMPLYPDAKINEPFELGDNIDRLDVRPDGARVILKR